MLVPPSPEELPPSLRAAMRQLAGGVSLITTCEGDQRGGFTATSVTSLTLDPPCVLVCVNRKVSALPAILRSKRLGVNILADRHAALAMRFSGATGVKGAARFDEGRWSLAAGAIPLLEDALAAIDCDLEDAVERHSHLILIGAVREVRLGEPGLPLIYAQGQYGDFVASASR